MKLKTKLSTLLLGITSIFALTAAIVTNPNGGNAIEAKAEPVTTTVDGSKLTSTATTKDSTFTFDGIDLVFSKGAKKQATIGTNAFTKDGAILIGKRGAYIYNTVPFGNGITSFEIYANAGASAKVSVGVNFSENPITSYNASLASTYKNTLSTLDKVYDASSAIPSGAKYFFYQVTNANNSQVQFRIGWDKSESSSVATLQSITATSTQKEVYQNEKLDESAITVTGHYDDGSEKVLSSGWTVECDTSVVATSVTATVTHTETNKKATFTVDVVEMPLGKTMQLVTSTSELSTGDKIVLVAQNDGKYYANGALGSNDYLSSIDVTTAINNSIILLDDFELLTVVKTASSYKFVFEDGKLLSVTTAKELTNTGDGDTEFTINISSEDNAATIQSKTETFGKFLYNATSPRFTTYTSKPTTAMLIPYIYKLIDGNDAGKYADEFLSTVTCDGQGSITAAEGFWNTESTKFDALSAADKKVFSLAEASESGSVEKCVNRYDAIVSKYGTTVYNDFMSRGIVSPSRAIFKPNIVEDAPITEIIVIASISAVTLIGLFAISKKRKEN